MKPSRSLVFVCFFTALVTVPAAAQENFELGKMWTFENPPLEYWKETYGFSPEQPWFDHARLASIRFGGGCSSSFVSPRGLIMTNHHCARDYIAKVSPKDKDWVRDGYFAQSLEEEVKVPGLTVQQLIKMEDVTARMNEGVLDSMDDKAIAAKRTENETAIMANAGKETPELKPQVVKLYQGAMFKLYRYKIWDDIRLCAAPNLQTAHYGGDPDNFTYPRYSIDFTFCRAWENGKPADTSKHFFKWSADGPKEGELVFVTGNPGSTDRAKTLAQIEYLRDAAYPIRLGGIDRRIEILQEYGQKSPENEKAVRTEILGIQNSQKAIRGFHGGLIDPKLMAAKADAEKKFRSKVEANPELRAKFADAFSKLEEISRKKTALEAKVRFQHFQGWRLLGLAYNLARITDPSVNDSARENNKAQAEAALEDLNEPIYDEASYADQLERAKAWLPKDDPFLTAILRGKSGAAAVAYLKESTRLRDAAFVRELIAKGPDAKDVKDPLLDVGRVLAPLLLKNQDEQRALAAEESVQSVRIGQALFAVYGTKIAPDATFTLRVADGVVKGYSMNGTLAPWRTSFHGLFARAIEFGNQYPFDLPPIWFEKKGKINMNRFVNFASTNDIIGGNSGSPVVNKNLEIVGLVFDGNIESLPNRFVFKEAVERTVSVHTDAMIECLTNVYPGQAIAQELLGKPGYN